MDEKSTTGQGAPQVTGQPSGSVAPTTPPETYTKEQVQKMVSDALAQAGRGHKAELTTVVKERDSLKAQIQTKDSELEDISAEREKLQEQIDELASGDPEKFNLVKKDKDLRERERQLRADKSALEAEKQVHQETIKLANDTLREISIWEIAAEYDGGNPVKLKDICEIFGASSEEQIRKAADTLWSKNPATTTPAAPPLRPDSGVTIGAGTLTVEQVKNMSPEERARRAKEIARLPLGMGLIRGG